MKKLPRKPHIYVVVGPTGVGKTALSLLLARKVGGEIISADSRQVYQGLTIGTEKISKRDMRGIRHHLLDVCDPKKVYSVSDFQKDATIAIAEILGRGAVPIIVGGTGWYVDALVKGQNLPDVPPNKVLRSKLEKLSSASLFARLQKLDPERAASVDRNNSRRLVRAIEIAQALGKVPEITETQPYHITWLGILPPQHYAKKLKDRLSNQLQRGLLREVRGLIKKKISKKRLRELGLEYRTALRYLDGEITRSQMIETMCSELQQLSKRQMTWFKRNKSIKWKLFTDYERAIQRRN